MLILSIQMPAKKLHREMMFLVPCLKEFELFPYFCTARCYKASSPCMKLHKILQIGRRHVWFCWGFHLHSLGYIHSSNRSTQPTRSFGLQNRRQKVQSCAISAWIEVLNSIQFLLCKLSGQFKLSSFSQNRISIALNSFLRDAGPG